MRIAKAIFIHGGPYPLHTAEDTTDWVPTPCGKMLSYQPTPEQQRIHAERLVSIDVPHGQRAIVVDEYCRKTGLRKDDGSPRYLDAGTIVILALIGGHCDGLIVWHHDTGNTLELEENPFYP